jgi:hypothetical protein
MIAVFFKNNKTETTEEDLLIQQQGQHAMQERMARMLRNEAKLSWMPPPAHLAAATGVKKSFSIRKVVSSAY